MSACFPFFLSCCALIATSSLVGVEVGCCSPIHPQHRRKCPSHTPLFQWCRGEKGWSQGRGAALYSILREWLINIQSPGWVFPSLLFYLSHISDPFTKHTQAARTQWPTKVRLVLITTDEQLAKWSKHGLEWKIYQKEEIVLFRPNEQNLTIPASGLIVNDVPMN